MVFAWIATGIFTCLFFEGWQLLVEKAKCDKRQNSKEQCRNLSHFSSIAIIISTSTNICIVFLHDSLVAINFLGIFRSNSLILFPGTASNYPNIPTNVLVNFSAHSSFNIPWDSLLLFSFLGVAIHLEIFVMYKFPAVSHYSKFIVTFFFFETVANVTFDTLSKIKDEEHG